jgi:hypothetical protein
MLVNMTTPLFVDCLSAQRFRRFKAAAENLIQMVNEVWSGRETGLQDQARWPGRRRGLARKTSAGQVLA